MRFGFAVLFHNGRVLELLRYDFRRLEYGFKDVSPAVLAGRGGQFGSDGTALIAESMAKETLRVIERCFPGRKISAVAHVVKRGFQILHFPMLGEMPVFGLLESGDRGEVLDPWTEGDSFVG